MQVQDARVPKKKVIRVWSIPSWVVFIYSSDTLQLYTLFTKGVLEIWSLALG